MPRTIYFVCAALLLIACSLAATQTGFRDSDSWGLVAGSVASVDPKNQAIDVLVRSGTPVPPVSWVEERTFRVSDLRLRAMSEPVQLKVAFTKDTKFWNSVGSRLERLESAPKIESGLAVLIELREDQRWNVKGTASTATAKALAAAKVVLLQACIEDSCTKAKCKGKQDCKEKVCDCPAIK